VPFLIRTILKVKVPEPQYCTELACKEMTVEFTNEAMHVDGEMPFKKNVQELHFKVLENPLIILC
jgi:hypothetical protein